MINSAAIFALVMAVNYSEEEINRAVREIESRMPADVKAYENRSSLERISEVEIARDMRNQPPAFRAKLIQWNRLLAYPLPGVVRNEVSLLLLGDPAVEQKYLQMAIKGGPDYESDVFGRYALPEHIALLAPHVSPYDEAKGGGATHAVISILRKSPAFSDEIDKWASFGIGYEPDIRAAQFQRWWEKNKEVLQSGQWNQVKPEFIPYEQTNGSRQSGYGVPLPSEAASFSLVANPTAPASPSPEPNVVAAPSASPPATPAIRKSESIRFRPAVFIAVGSLVLILGFLVQHFLRRAK